MAITIADKTGTQLKSVQLGDYIAKVGDLNNIKDSLVSEIENIQSASEVELEVATTPTTGYLKTYVLSQGGTEVGKIDIPKDLVVTSGSVVTAGDGTGGTEVVPGATAGDKYIKLVIANQSEPVYIAVKDLVDVYTGSTDANGISISIGNDNSISATLNKADGTKVELTKIDGSTKITAQAAFAAMNSTTTASTAAADTTSADNGVSVVSTVSQVDGVVSTTTVKADKYGAASKALTDAKDYTDTEIGKLTGSADIASVSDGVVTIKHGVGESDGVISNDNGIDITLAKVATTGAAEDISIADSGSLITATTVEGALAELAGELDAIDYSGKADKVTGATAGNFAGLDANGNLTDSGSKASDFATAAQGALADTAIQSVTGETALTGTSANDDYISVSATQVGTDVTIDSKVKIQQVSTSGASVKGLAEASDVKDYVDTKVGTAIQSVTGDDYVNATTDASNNVTIEAKTSDTVSDYVSTTTSKKLATTKGVASYVEGLSGDVDASSSDSAVSTITGVDVVTGVTTSGGKVTAVDSAKADKFGSAAKAQADAQSYALGLLQALGTTFTNVGNLGTEDTTTVHDLYAKINAIIDALKALAPSA